MKILFDINHPAHVHYSKNLIKKLIDNDHQVIITARNRDPIFKLLQKENLNYINRGKGSKKLLGKLLYFLKGDYELLKIAVKENPDLFVAFMSPYAPQVSKMLGKPCILFDDTEHASLHQYTTYPFCDVILTPSCYRKELGKKHFRFNSYLELAYLHPSVFMSDMNIRDKLNIMDDKKLYFLRFVDWQAHHDIGHSGLTLENKRQIVNKLNKLGHVIISSERELPKDLKKYQYNIHPSEVHHVLSQANLFIGESATMASEAAVLGTPAIYIDNVGRGYTDEEENKYSLVYNFSESLEDQARVIDKAVELASHPKDMFIKSRKKLLEDMINLTEFMFWFITKYPESNIVMQRNSDYQSKFK